MLTSVLLRLIIVATPLIKEVTALRLDSENKLLVMIPLKHFQNSLNLARTQNDRPSEVRVLLN